jgi:glycosyltransferase involved in cell wall biosynthesis
MKISVIIPVYNEFRTFNQVLERVRQAPLPQGCSKEIVVVDDGSTDGTTQMLGEHTREGLVVGHRSARNYGKGAAIRTGIMLASGDIVLIQDGDLEYDPGDYARILEPIVRGEADIVYGSRFLGQPAGMAMKNRIAIGSSPPPRISFMARGLPTRPPPTRPSAHLSSVGCISNAGGSSSARKSQPKRGVWVIAYRKCPSLTTRGGLRKARRSVPAMAYKLSGR